MLNTYVKTVGKIPSRSEEIGENAYEASFCRTLYISSTEKMRNI